MKPPTLLQQKNQLVADLSKLYSTTEAAAISKLLIEDIFELKPHEIAYADTDTISEFEKKLHLFRASQIRLINGEPIQHILGYSWFGKHKLKVNSDVLIPRPETEELCLYMMKVLQKDTPQLGLDIGTGSGCISIYIAAEMENCTMHAIDNSKSSLIVANQNIVNQRLEAKIKLIEVDISDYNLQYNYTFIVSNPPYISLDESKTMHPNVLNFEPHSALFVYNSDPLYFYKIVYEQFTHNSAKHLFFEINPLYSELLCNMIQEDYSFVTIKDMQGANRFVHIYK